MSDENIQEDPNPAPKKRGRPGRKVDQKTIPPLKWAEVEADWADGKFANAIEASKVHGIPADQIATHMSRKGIKRGANIDHYNRQLQKELEEKAARHAKVLAERIEETNEEHYRWASGLAKLTFAEVAQARQNGTPLGAVRSNLQSLESAMKVLKMAREERYAVLGLNSQDKESAGDELPELAVAELQHEQIEEMRARDTSTDDVGDGVEVLDLEETSVEEVDEDDPEAD